MSIFIMLTFSVDDCLHELRGAGSCDLFQCDDDFSFGASFRHIPKSFRNLIKRILSIDHRDDFASFTKLRDGNQVFVILWNCENAYISARCSFYPWPQKQDLE